MHYRRLGRSGLSVSAYCLGTMTFGESSAKSMMHEVGCDAATSHAIMNRALELGVNFFDTADVYGDDGMSERVIGDWFQASGQRDRVVLATKFRFRMGEGPNTTGASRFRIVRACEASLRRLKTDRIELYQIHMQDLDTPEEETLRALDDLVRAGKVLYIGCSNYAAYRLSDSLWTSATKSLEGFVSLQAQYSLIARGLERELQPICREKGLGILAWSPLAGGFLTGKHERDKREAGSRLAKWSQWWSRYDTDRGWRAVDTVRKVSSELGVPPGQVALAWVSQQPCVTSVIFGARSIEQLEQNVAAAPLVLSAPHLAELDAASALELDYPHDFLKQVAGGW